MFVWKEEFELGIDSIDDQHKMLLEIGNRVNELLKEYVDGDDTYDEIVGVISELKDYTIYHFQTEESLLEKYNYPELAEHKKEHTDFVEYLNSIDFDSVDEDQSVFLKELLSKLVNWVFKHIITTDFLYKDYLISQNPDI